jgi:hypothetical protein
MKIVHSTHDEIVWSFFSVGTYGKQRAIHALGVLFQGQFSSGFKGSHVGILLGVFNAFNTLEFVEIGEDVFDGLAGFAAVDEEGAFRVFNLENWDRKGVEV